MADSLVHTIWDAPVQNAGATGAAGGTAGAFNLNPQPQAGQGAFGAVPGAIGMPQNPYMQLQGAYQPFMQQMGVAGANISNELAGNVDLDSLARQAAAHGIGSGMPGSGFQAATGLNMTQQATQAMQRQGLQDYMGLSGMLGSMMTPQSLAYQIAERNATMGAAPTPQAAYQRQLNDYLAMRNNAPGGSGYGQPVNYQAMIPQSERDMSWFYNTPSGGTGSYASPVSNGNGYGYVSGLDGDYYSDSSGVYDRSLSQYTPFPTLNDYSNMMYGSGQWPIQSGGTGDTGTDTGQSWTGETSDFGFGWDTGDY